MWAALFPPPACPPTGIAHQPPPHLVGSLLLFGGLGRASAPFPVDVIVVWSSSFTKKININMNQITKMFFIFLAAGRWSASGRRSRTCPSWRCAAPGAPPRPPASESLPGLSRHYRYPFELCMRDPKCANPSGHAVLKNIPPLGQIQYFPVVGLGGGPSPWAILRGFHILTAEHPDSGKQGWVDIYIHM